MRAGKSPGPITILFVIALSSTTPFSDASSQTMAREQVPSDARITIYRVAPGKHIEFLEWVAVREQIDQEVGIPPTKWFVHLDGAEWDYLAISPVIEPALEKKAAGLASERGLATGFAASVEIREFLSSHTDTLAWGPTTAAETLKRSTASK